MRKTRVLAAMLLLAVVAATASAQRYRLPEGPQVPPRFPPARFADGAFTHCKLMYNSVRSEANGIGWATDYPYAGINLMTRVAELTKTPISRDKEGEPNYWVVTALDDALFQCTFTMATDVGTAGFSDQEVKRLREYLLKGGFLWVDDFWGPYAWDTWVEQISRVLPPAQFPIRDLMHQHPIYRTLFEVAAIPQIPSIAFWRASGGGTSERGEDSAEVHLRGIMDEHGRVMVLMTHNTDISDAWEREGEDPQFFFSFSPNGYAVGLNTVLYAMTH
jgi:Domain of unknown function (DUF4159)